MKIICHSCSFLHLLQLQNISKLRIVLQTTFFSKNIHQPYSLKSDIKWARDFEEGPILKSQMYFFKAWSRQEAEIRLLLFIYLFCLCNLLKFICLFFIIIIFFFTLHKNYGSVYIWYSRWTKHILHWLNSAFVQ